MNSSKGVLKEIIQLTHLLVGSGLSANQNYPLEKTDTKGIVSVEWKNVENLSISLRNIEYKEIYNELDKNRDYSIKLLDGALVHMMYKFKDNEIISHRLAFYPSPKLESYQNEPELYEEDEIYADVIYKNIVAFPIRFDYNKDEVKSEYPHPISHGSLGQYKNCRIPVWGPVSPRVFMEFIFKNFYSKAFYKFLHNKMPKFCTTFTTIKEYESKELHFNLVSD